MESIFSATILPDVEELLSVLRREKRPQRVHHIELYLDQEIKNRVCDRFDLGSYTPILSSVKALQTEVRLHALLGYDVFWVRVIQRNFFPVQRNQSADTALNSQNRGQRAWMEEQKGPIQNWKDFDQYPWPRIEDIDLKPLEWMERNLPENMGCFDLTAHILELSTFLLGYETLCFKIYDEPDLVDAVVQRIGNFYLDYTRLLCDFRCNSLVWGADDMGFRSSTFVSPQFLREKILPWHRACAEVAHSHGRPYLLHACGCLDEIMEDLIETVGIDGKHSFEDTVMPVEEALKKYGNKTAILGGIDMHFLCCSDEAAIRNRVRKTLNDSYQITNGTGYCLGTGNSVANYIPLDNYLTMLDEGRCYRLQ